MLFNTSFHHDFIISLISLLGTEAVIADRAKFGARAGAMFLIALI